MKRDNPWLKKAKKTITPIKHILANSSVRVRAHQYEYFKRILKPNKNSRVLDVGVSADETLKDSNIFERLYGWPKNITAATIEDTKDLKRRYPKIKVVKIYPHKRLPFKSKSFDIVVAWATLEHVGGYKKQEEFINELLRVGKKIFLTTPNRGIFYEPHSGIFFLHWLPLSLFRKICYIFGKKFWSEEENLNPLYANDLYRMKLKNKVDIKIYKMVNVLPSHIIISSK